MFAESLSVRILADSSSLRTELNAALGQLDQFQSRVSALSDAGRQLGAAFSSLSRAIAPLQQIHKFLVAIQQQIRAIGQTPLTINVAPALGALAKLAAAVDAVAARLYALSGIAAAQSVMAPAVGMTSFTGVTAPIVATGFPAGLPAKYSLPALAVPNASAPQGLAPSATPTAFAPVPERTREPAAKPASAAGDSPTTNHFGGITIHVRETADVNALVRDLRLQGIHLRNRRG